MMRRTFTFLLGMVLLAASPAHAAGGDDNDSLRAALSARYESMRLATEKRDGKALAELLAPGFESLSLRNESKNRDAMIHDIDALPSKKASTTPATTINDVRRVGDKAFVDETYRLDRINHGPRGRSRSYRVVTGVSDTWVKTGGKWLLEKSVANESDIFIDGMHMARQVRGKKMKIDKTYKEQMKEKKASQSDVGGSCGGTATTPSCGKR